MIASPLSKEQVLQVGGQFLELAAELKEEKAIERTQSELRDYRLGLFRLVVIGEVKKGKSRFINSLLGEPELLPVSSDVTTATVFKLIYGEKKRYKIFFLPQDVEKPETRPAPLEVPADQVAEYGTEDGNPANKKRVEFIGVELPHPLLQSGVAIVDTPGLGGFFRDHAPLTWRYVPNADAVFFVLDSVEAVASKAEVESLKRLRKMTPLLFFVQTKVDLVDAERWQQWRERNLDILGHHLQVPKEKLLYFPVSSVLKDIADKRHSPKDLNRSGFLPLLYFFHEKLLKTKEQNLARSLLRAIAVESAGIRRRVGDDFQVCNSKTKEELDTLERESSAAKAKFDQWRALEYQRAVSAFQDRSNDLKRETMDVLQNRLDPSPHGPVIKPLVTQLRQSEADAGRLNAEAGAIQSRCIDICSQAIFDIQGQYNHWMRQIIGETVQKLGQSCAVDMGSTVKGVAAPTAEGLNVHLSGFEAARNVLYGMIAGGMMVHLLTSLVFPPAGAAAFVAQVIGPLAGGLFANRDLQARHREEAINKLQNLLADTVRVAQKQAIQQFQSTAAEFERFARQAFDHAASEVHRELQGKLASIGEARKRTQQDNQNKAAYLRTMMERTDNLLRTVGRMGGQETHPAQRE